MAAKRRRSLRFRITIAATLIVTLAVVAGAALFVAILRESLVDGVRSAAQTDAAALVTRIEAAGMPGIDREPERDGRIFQVVDADGAVVQSSRRAGDTALATALTDATPTVMIDGEPYILSVVGADYSQTAVVVDGSGGGRSRPAAHGSDDDSSDDGSGSGNDGGSGGSGSGDDNGGSGGGGDGGDDGNGDDNGGGNGGEVQSPSPVPTVTVTTSPSEPATETITTAYIVVAGRSTAAASTSIQTVVQLLLVAVPLLIVFIAATTWFTVARSLRPVDRMRAELDEVTSANLHRRIADPRSADEIGRLATTMNGVLDRLDESQRAQRRFVSDASHELKSPLASLRQYAEVSAAHPDRISQSELAEAVLDEGARLERLVQGMLVLAKADEQLLDAGHAPVDLDDLLLAEARRVRAGGRVTVDSSGVGPGRVAGDEGMLAQVVRNLVDNAVRHAVDSIALSVTETDAGVVIRVDDDGEGVAVSERGHIFDRFVRLDEARARESGGSGLGLSIVRELVRAHGGTVTVEDAPLGGARFAVTLPPAPDRA